MKTILILTNFDGGLYHFRKELLKRLIEKGYSVIVSMPEGEYTSKIEKMGVECISTSLERHGMNPVKEFRLFLKYGSIIKNCKPDVILTYTIKPNLFGAIQAGIRKVPCIVNVTGLGTALQNPGILQKILLKMYRTALKKADCVFFQNRENYEFMEKNGCIRGKARLIAGSGVNLKEYPAVPYPENTGQVHILAITRIMKDKGIGELLTAAEHLKKEYPELVFDIVGDYEEDTREQYEPKVEELQKKGIINYHGYQKDVRPFLKECRLLVHPTYHEGMSNVLLEAEASARPVAASDISGCRETFVNGVGGIVFASGSAAALEEAVRNFVEMDYETQKAMGEAARLYVEGKFDREKIVDAYLEEIELIK